MRLRICIFIKLPGEVIEQTTLGSQEVHHSSPIPTWQECPGPQEEAPGSMGKYRVGA